jgi:hypothetical protein
MKPSDAKAIREFYKKHPELHNKERNLVTSFSPYQRRLNVKRLEAAEAILKSLELYPDDDVKTVLSMYYEGHPISVIAKSLGKTKAQTSRYIFGLIVKVKRFANEGLRINIKGRKKHQEVTLMHKGEMRTVYLVNIRKGELAWVRADGLILPDEVQDLLG